MRKHLYLFLVVTLCLSIGLVCAEESNVTVIEENQTTAIPDTSNLPVERIAQGQCVEIGRYYDISGVIGWSTQFSYYGKYDTDLSPENGTYKMEKIIDHPMTMKGLSKYYIDPEIFGNSEGYWYQVSTLSVNSNHEWAGNLRAFRVQSYCPEQNPATTNTTQLNKEENISNPLPLPIEHVTDILVVRGDSVSYNNPKISDGSRVWVFGITNGLYDQPTVNKTLVFNPEQTQSLPEGRYHVIIDSPGKNELVESKYNSNEVVSSPLKATPDLSFRGLSSQVAYGNYVDWVWKYSDDELTLVDMQVQNPYINIYSVETTDVVNHTGLTIKGYTNLRSGSIVYGVINEDDYGALATKSYGAVIGDSVGDMRQFIIQSKVDINDLVVGKELFVTVHGEHNSETTVPFYVYPTPADHYVDKQYNKYVSGNLYVPTPTPEIITLPSPTPEIIIQTVTITVPVTPSDEQVRDAQRDVIGGGHINWIYISIDNWDYCIFHFIVYSEGEVMSLKEYFEDGRDAQRKHSQKQTIRKQYAPIRLKPKKLEFYDPRLVIRGAGIVYEMLSPLFLKLPISKKKIAGEPKRKGKPVLSAMLAVMQKDIDSLLVRLRVKKPKNGYDSYREFLDLAERKK